MTLRCETVNVDLPGSSPGSTTRDAVVTGLGDVQFALFFTAVGDSPSPTADAWTCIGYLCRPNAFHQASVAIFGVDDIATTQEYRRTTYGYAVHIVSTTESRAVWQAGFITDGIRLTCSSHATTYDFRCQVVMFSGSSIENVVSFDSIIPAGTGTVSKDAIGFQPDLLLSIYAGTAIDQFLGDAAISFGIAGNHQGLGNAVLFNTGFSSNNAQTGSSKDQSSNNKTDFLHYINDMNGGYFGKVYNIQFDANGFDYDYSDGSGTERFFGIAIKMKNPEGIYIGEFSLPATATGTLTTAAQDIAPVFGLISGIDGVETNYQEFAANVSGWQQVGVTQDDVFGFSFSNEEANASVTNTWTQLDETTPGTVGGLSVRTATGGDMDGTVSWTVDRELKWQITAGHPLRITHYWYFLLSDPSKIRVADDNVVNIYVGADAVDAVYVGADLVQ